MSAARITVGHIPGRVRLAARVLAVLGLTLPLWAGAQEPTPADTLPSFTEPTEAPAADTLPTHTNPPVLAPVTVTVERERSTPPPVTTLDVDPEQLRRTLAANPYDLIRRVTGIEVHDHGQGPGFAPNVVIRGFTSDHSSDVLLLIDGVPINLPINGHQEGYADWYLLLPAAVSSMRVIYGTASPLYGNFALGGVIEVFTAADADGTTASASGSSKADLEGWLRTGFRRESGGGLLAFDARREHGWRDHSGSWLGNGLLRGWKQVGSSRLEGGFQLFATDWDSPGFLTVEQFNAGDLEDAVDSTDGGSAWRAIAHGRYSASLGGSTALEATAWAQAAQSHVFLNVPEEGSATGQTDEEDERFGAGGQLQISMQPALGELTLGLAGRADGADYELFDTEARDRVSAEKSFDADYATGAAFGRWRRVFFHRLGLDLGARIDALRYVSRDRLAEDGTSRHTDVLASPKLGARYQLGAATALFASVSRGFRGPPGVIEDPDVPPLVAWSAETGVEHHAGSLDARVALFRLDVDHERVQDPVTREISNLGSSVRQGVDVSGRLGLPYDSWLEASATFNDARLSDQAGDGSSAAGASASLAGAHPGGASVPQLAHEGPLVPGDRVPGVARYVGRVGIGALVAGRYETRASWRFTGPYVPIGEPDLDTRAYGVLDLGASVPWGDSGVALDLELQNALDRKYPEIRASGFINPGAPRMLLAALRFEL
jgi:outer membrane receptor protein involved in Fe transport